MLRRLVRLALGVSLWEPASIRGLKRLAEQLNDKASRFRTVAARAVLLEQRIELLEVDSRAWEARAKAVHDAGLSSEVARVCGRLEGQLQAARTELAALHTDEAHLRSLLTDGRRAFAELVDQARSLGHDVSGCLLYVDLTRPECPADDSLLADEDRAFVARVIDSQVIH